MVDGLGDEFIVADDLGEAVLQPVSIEGQAKLILVGQLDQNPGLVFLGHIQERSDLQGLAGWSTITSSSLISGAVGILTSCHW